MTVHLIARRGRVGFVPCHRNPKNYRVSRTGAAQCTKPALALTVTVIRCGFGVENPTSGPTGKSLPIYGNCVKPGNQKYFCFTEWKSALRLCPSRPTQRGVGHRHDEGRVAVDAVRVAGRAARIAYGKDVWSRRRDAGVHAPGRRPISQGATEAKEPFSGESSL